MVKVYLICIDAFPELDGLTEYLFEQKCHRADLICAGAFTCATFSSIISGRLGTELYTCPEGKGLGYHTQYKPYYHDWRKNKDCLVDRLINNQTKVIIHNHLAWFSHNMAGDNVSIAKTNPTLQQTDWGVSLQSTKPTSDKNLTFTACHPDKSLDTFLEWDVEARKEKFYQQEKAYIQYLQARTDSFVHVTDLCHWHEAIYYNGRTVKKEIAIEDTLAWLKLWQWQEPEAVFYVMADHSYRVQNIPGPDDYITWLYSKDNRVVNNEPTKFFVSSLDFYAQIEHLFKLPSLKLPLSIPFHKPYEMSRIYWMEDGRANATSKHIATTFTACRLVNQHILQVTLSKAGTTEIPGYYVFMGSMAHKYRYLRYHYTQADLVKLVECMQIDGQGPLGTRTLQVVTQPPKILSNLWPLVQDLAQQVKMKYD